MRRSLSVIVALLCACPAFASSSSTGQSGLVHMPDGRINEDGIWQLGFTRMAPYSAIWSSLTVLPRLEVSGRFTQSDDIEAFGGDTGFGDHKDKAFDAKLLLVREDGWIPSVSVGVQDFHGTRLFPAEYLAASKRIGDFDITAGYGRQRIDGAFGGVRWTPPWGPRRVTLLAEYDAIDYANDFHTRRTGELVREGGITAGVEYHGDLYTLQAAHQDGTWGINAYMRLPLHQRTFVPKTAEPAPVELDPVVRHAWTELPDDLAATHAALAAEGIVNVRIRIEGTHIRASVSGPRYSTIGRAVSRAARVIALTAPDRFETLELTFVEGNLPVATYRFDDLALLRGYFTHEVEPSALQPTLGIAYVDARRYTELRDTGLHLDAGVETMPGAQGAEVNVSEAAASSANRMVIGSGPRPVVLQFRPANVSIAFNDRAGALRYEVFSSVTAVKWLSDDLYTTTSARVTLLENFSELDHVSNSVLPRVRSDIAEYLRDQRRVSLSSAIVGHISNPRDRIYTSFSAGYLERMFGGAGGEVLYLPQTGNWAVDFHAFAVKQRDFDGGFGFRDYETITAIGSFHYRIPSQGLTFTARAGRFLAKDLGVRFEAKRRFRSGFEAGAWYSHTDGKDITSPGSPENPYRDKGIFIRIAVGPFLARDNAHGVNIGMAAWTRDPGQMIHAPGRLYDVFERRLMLNIDDFNPWSDFGQ